MYWRFGQKILSAAEIIREIPNLYPVYITNFGCGPDSFITHFFADRLAGKPYLQIEIDEHSADAGIVTRLEAFLDSLAGVPLEKRISSEVPCVIILQQRYSAEDLYSLYVRSCHPICGRPARLRCALRGITGIE